MTEILLKWKSLEISCFCIYDFWICQIFSKRNFRLISVESIFAGHSLSLRQLVLFRFYFCCADIRTSVTFFCELSILSYTGFLRTFPMYRSTKVRRLTETLRFNPLDRFKLQFLTVHALERFKYVQSKSKIHHIFRKIRNKGFQAENIPFRSNNLKWGALAE